MFMNQQKTNMNVNRQVKEMVVNFNHKEEVFLTRARTDLKKDNIQKTKQNRKGRKEQ